MSHFADKAAFVAALAQSDPERQAAEEHARSCCMCRDALDEGLRLTRLLAEAPPLPPPTAEALERAARAIAYETRADQRARSGLGWGTAAAVLAAFGLQIKFGSGLARDLRSVMVSLLVLSAALAGGALARPKRRLVVAALVLTSALLAAAVSSSPLLLPEVGWICVLFELGAGCLTWAVAAGIARAGQMVLERWQGASVAAAGALASGAAQHLTCPAAHAGLHLLVFHCGGVLLAALLGATGTLLSAAQRRSIRA